MKPNPCHLPIRRILGLACAAGLGLATDAWSLQGGQGGPGSTSGPKTGGTGGASNNGGNSGAPATVTGSAGYQGTGGEGGGLIAGAGGAGGAVGLLVNSTVTVAVSATGLDGGDGDTNGFPDFSGGGGGGGGDGIYATIAVVVTVNSGVTIVGGKGGGGANGCYYCYANPGGGGGSGGGGSGVAFHSAGNLINKGIISGATGGAAGEDGGGGGGGHGVAGAGITITNSGTIAGGSKGAGNGTAGDAIAFLGGFNQLILQTGSTISGDIELESGTTAEIRAQDGGLTLSNDVKLNGLYSNAYFTTDTESLTVSGIISGPGYLQAGPLNGGKTLILAGANTFTGGSTVYSGTLEVDGSVGRVTIEGGLLGGTGAVGNVVLNFGAIAPGGSPGTLHAKDLKWNGGGAFDFELGATTAQTDTDLLALSGTLTRGIDGTFRFHFSDGIGPAAQNVTYTLIEFAGSQGFSAADFSYDYDGATSGFSGTFRLTPTALQFLSGDLVFEDGFEAP